MTNRRLLLVSGALVAALTLTACGGAKPTAPVSPAAPAPTPTPGPQTLTITLKDFSFEPEEITAVKGQRVILTLKNAGEKNHDIILQGAYDGIKSEKVGPGAEGTFEFVADKAGTFEFICDQKGHKDKGMVGHITVTDK